MRSALAPSADCSTGCCGGGPIMAGQLRDATLVQKLYYETGEPATPTMLKATRARLPGA